MTQNYTIDKKGLIAKREIGKKKPNSFKYTVGARGNNGFRSIWRIKIYTKVDKTLKGKEGKMENGEWRDVKGNKSKGKNDEWDDEKKNKRKRKKKEIRERMDKNWIKRRIKWREEEIITEMKEERR